MCWFETLISKKAKKIKIKKNPVYILFIERRTLTKNKVTTEVVNKTKSVFGR